MSFSQHTVGRKQGVPLPLIQQRKTCIVGLHLSGFTTKQIQEAVGTLNNVFGWGTVSVRQIQRCLQQHFDGRPLTSEQVKSASVLQRDAALGQMEQCLEDVALYGYDKRTKDTKAFLHAIQTRAYIIQCIISARGFNMSAKDYGHWAAGTPVSMQVYRGELERAGGRARILEKLAKEHGVFPY